MEKLKCHTNADRDRGVDGLAVCPGGTPVKDKDGEWTCWWCGDLCDPPTLGSESWFRDKIPCVEERARFSILLGQLQDSGLSVEDVSRALYFSVGQQWKAKEEGCD